MSKPRERQLAYSTLQSKMLDEDLRRSKGEKIRAVVQHFLGVESLTGLTVLDVGCSAGLVAATLAEAGATVIGVDIDQPGLHRAAERFGDALSFVLADSEQLPLGDQSVDVVVCNHVYEHVLDPDALMRELRRVVRPTGALYLGLGNRLGVMEPHYRLPFLSYLPRGLADRYVRAFDRADHYHEQFRTRAGLLRLVRGLTVWDYTWTLLAEPDRFAAADIVPGPVTRLPPRLVRALRPVVPTFIWVGSTAAAGRPAGAATRVAPEKVVG
jgi:2-polyprenyl-3-methyl-5-hydroxy-6-metoxy-1,4-benzoquinol methylase